MTAAATAPAWVAIATSVLLVFGAALTLIGSFGLIRLRSFYARVHAPTLGTTLGTAAILAASIVWFSASQSRLVLHEILIAVFVTITTPVALMLLVRAAAFRDNVGVPKGETSAADDGNGKAVPPAG